MGMQYWKYFDTHYNKNGYYDFKGKEQLGIIHLTFIVFRSYNPHRFA
jgi:hypothetical protein